MNKTMLLVIALCVFGLGFVALGIGALIGRYTSEPDFATVDPLVTSTADPSVGTDSGPAVVEQPNGLVPVESATNPGLTDDAAKTPAESDTPTAGLTTTDDAVPQEISQAENVLEATDLEATPSGETPDSPLSMEPMTEEPMTEEPMTEEPLTEVPETGTPETGTPETGEAETGEAETGEAETGERVETECCGKPIVKTWTGKVVSVNGDSIRVVDSDNESIRIRLEAIDCPEPGQPHHEEAKQALNDLIDEQTVTVLETGKDRFERVLGFVEIGETNIAEWMISEGHAWHFKHYSEDETLAAAETGARAANKGLWAGTDPVEPWEWRNQNDQ